MLKFNREVLQKAINEYGTTVQTVVAIEEMAELQKELTKSIRGVERFDGLIEEIADVYIMLEQVRMMYALDENIIQPAIDAKLARLRSKIGVINDEHL